MTLGELLVAMTITLFVMGALVGLLHGAQGTFQALPEAADMEQRLRAGVDALSRDLLMAGAGRQHGSLDPCEDEVSVLPSRSDAISIVFVPRSQTGSLTRTYYLDSDPSTSVSELIREDAGGSRIPVVDHLVRVAFAYFGDGSTPLDPAALEDGPWCDEEGPEPFDADLTRIRRVRVTLRAEAALDSARGPAGQLFLRAGTATTPGRYVPDQEVTFDVSPRNLNLDR
jgi:hypothetical protein